MPRRQRLDAELVRRGLARSRDHAAGLIAEGRVRIAGAPARKAATGVTTDAALVVRPGEETVEYVSRGGHKLAPVLEEFTTQGLSIAGRSALDVGASTGGFTDVLLRAGADRVTTVDVGYGQLAWSLRQDDRVLVRERTNVRTLDPHDFPGRFDLLVGDLSFISLRLVLPSLVGLAEAAADYVVLVKPQFEVGKDRVGKGGVVREAGPRAEAVTAVARSAHDLGLGVRGLRASPLPGPAGNVEYFLWLHAEAPAIDVEAVGDIVAAGPQ